MMDTGLLLRLPTESIAIRVVIASVAAVLLARLVLRAGLRVPRVRVVAAMIPAIALAAVLVMFGTELWAEPALPELWVPVDAVDGLPVPIRDTYLTFAPLAAPLLLGVWVTAVLIRLGLRARRIIGVRRRVLAAFRAGTAAPEHVHRIVAGVARRMNVALPPMAVVDRCPGGATVVGLRHPVLVMDAALLAQLDDRELEGVVAHELAHVRRRDNLVATVLGAVGDLFFFVPGGRWALRHLHAERELAADALAVDVTSRPAALASGLLKVLEAGSPQPACAALVPRGTLVGRVQHLIDDREPASRLRSGAELTAVAVIVVAAVAAAVELPGVVADAGQREALGLVWSNIQAEGPEDAATAPQAEPRAFAVYRDSRIETTSDPVRRVPIVDDDPDAVRPDLLRACGQEGRPCPDAGQTTSYSLGLKPKPVVRTDEKLVDRWRLDPVVTTNDGLAVFWFQRVD